MVTSNYDLHMTQGIDDGSSVTASVVSWSDVEQLMDRYDAGSPIAADHQAGTLPNGRATARTVVVTDGGSRLYLTRFVDGVGADVDDLGIPAALFAANGSTSRDD